MGAAAAAADAASDDCVSHCQMGIPLLCSFFWAEKFQFLLLQFLARRLGGPFLLLLLSLFLIITGQHCTATVTAGNCAAEFELKLAGWLGEKLLNIRQRGDKTFFWEKEEEEKVS